jgi:hypothetical protein
MGGRTKTDEKAADTSHDAQPTPAPVVPAPAPVPNKAPEAMTDAERKASATYLAGAGNRAAVTALAGDPAAAVEDLAGKAPIDTVDPFLASRLQLFSVELVGLKMLVSIDKTSSWRKRYTRSAMSQAALAAALNTMHGVKVDVGALQKVYAAALASGALRLELTPEEDPERFWIYIDKKALDTVAGHAGLTPDVTTARWEGKFAAARFLAFGIDEIAGAIDSLAPYLTEQKLGVHHLTVGTITHLLTARRETAIEIAKTHPATAGWRLAFQRDADLVAGRREAAFADFPHASPEQWADVAIALAVAARDVIREATTREFERQRKQGVNDYLSPHEVEVDNAAAFIADHFDDKVSVTLQPMGWDLHGGETWTNIKGASIFVLGVSQGYVYFQDVKTTHFFTQTVDGFAQEQLYSIYAEAGRKSLKAITITRFLLAVAGDIFPVVRYGLIATEVLTIIGRLHQYEGEIKAAYAEFKTAYRNVDDMLDDLLPALFSAEHLKIFNPLAHPDWLGWARSVLRFALQHAASKGAGAITMMDEMVFEVVTSVWKTVKKGLMAVVHAGSVLFPGVASSAGAATPADAVEHAKRLLSDAGVGGAERLTRAMINLPPADQQRLAREVQALLEAGTSLIAVLTRVVQW